MKEERCVGTGNLELGTGLIVIRVCVIRKSGRVVCAIRDTVVE